MYGCLTATSRNISGKRARTYGREVTSANRRLSVLYSTFVYLVAIERQRRGYSDATSYYQTTHCVEAVKRHEERDGLFTIPRRRTLSPSYPLSRSRYRNPSLHILTFEEQILSQRPPEAGMCKLGLLICALTAKPSAMGRRAHIPRLCGSDFPPSSSPPPRVLRRPLPSHRLCRTRLRVPPAHAHPRMTCVLVLVCTDPAARR